VSAPHDGLGNPRVDLGSGNAFDWSLAERAAEAREASAIVRDRLAAPALPALLEREELRHQPSTVRSPPAGKLCAMKTLRPAPAWSESVEQLERACCICPLPRSEGKRLKPGLLELLG